MELLESTPSPLRMWNPDGKVERVNTTARRTRVAVWLACHEALAATTRADRERLVRRLIVTLMDHVAEEGYAALEYDLAYPDERKLSRRDDEPMERPVTLVVADGKHTLE